MSAEYELRPFLKPDGWEVGNYVHRDKNAPVRYRDRLMLNSNGPIESVAVSITRTGWSPDRNGLYRVKITFPGDGEPDVVVGGLANMDALLHFDEVGLEVGMVFYCPLFDCDIKVERYHFNADFLVIVGSNYHVGLVDVLFSDRELKPIGKWTSYARQV